MQKMWGQLPWNKITYSLVRIYMMQFNIIGWNGFGLQENLHATFHISALILFFLPQIVIQSYNFLLLFFFIFFYEFCFILFSMIFFRFVFILYFVCGFVMQITCLIQYFYELSMSCVGSTFTLLRPKVSGWSYWVHIALLDVHIW